MGKGLFITASGPEIGKTFVTAALITQLRAMGREVAAYKPILSGFDEAELAASDTGVLLSALGRPLSSEEAARLIPWRYKAALSPDMAAAREGATIDFAEVVEFTNAALAGPEDIVLIEGVGGVMAPIGTAHTVLDWLTAATCPALLVVGAYLGAISHTLTAARTLEAAGVPLAGVVISARGDLPVPAEETARAIERFLPNAPIVVLSDCGGAPEAWRQAPDLLTPLGLF